jgi:general secretion pathway protein K
MMLKRQRGVAVITALLLTTLAISIVASLFWQQQVQVRSMENQRLHLQTKWIQRGALDWATLVLRQDGWDNKGYTSLDQVWATPLAETRLDQYIERERVEGEVFDATLRGTITDATSRYNLRNLADNGKVDTKQVDVFKRLLQNVQVDPGLAQKTAQFVAAGQPVVADPQGGGGPPAPPSPPQQPQRAAGSAPMKLLQVEDLLAVPGFTPDMIEKLRRFVIVLPELAPVNVNTAPPEVLAALLQNYSVSEANSLVARRKQAPWRDLANFDAEMQQRKPEPGTADVKSEWFLIDSHIRLDRAALHSQALVQRQLDGASPLRGQTSVKWIRQN